jgi:hypothetical protein
MQNDKTLLVLEQLCIFNIRVQLNLNNSNLFINIFVEYFLLIELTAITKDYLFEFLCIQGRKTVYLINHLLNLQITLLLSDESSINQLLIFSLQNPTIIKGFI